MRSLEAYADQNCVRRCLCDVSQLFETQPYVIPAEDLSQFLTTASPQFSPLSLAYNLPALIHLSLLAKREDITNVKALIMGNWFEILRYQLACPTDTINIIRMMIRLMMHELEGELLFKIS